MHRFHFHLHGHDHVAHDDEGRVLPSFEAALQSASGEAESRLAADQADGRPSPHHIEIVDSYGIRLALVPLGETGQAH